MHNVLYTVLQTIFNSVGLLIVHVLYSVQVTYTCYMSLMFKTPNIVYEHTCLALYSRICTDGYILAILP